MLSDNLKKVSRIVKKKKVNKKAPVKKYLRTFGSNEGQKRPLTQGQKKYLVSFNFAYVLS